MMVEHNIVFAWILLSVLYVDGLRAEVGVIQAQCQCTCPIYTQQIQDVISGKEGTDVTLDKESLVNKVTAETTISSTVSSTTTTPTTSPITTPTTSPSTSPTTTPTTTPTEPITTQFMPTTTSDYGSGDGGIYPYNDFNIDDIFTDVREEVIMVKSRYPTHPNYIGDDDTFIDPPQEVRAAAPAVVGQKGEKGGLGNPGPPGLDGTNGLDGTAGEPGNPGSKGNQGIPGPRGLKGEQGMRGFPGAVGLQGYTGAAGSMGEPGRQGPRGGDGSRGPRGEQGPLGRRGSKGNTGQKGERGESGAPGQDLTKDSTGADEVAFVARLLDHFGPSTVTTHIIFSQIDINLGQGFEPYSGAFNVPVSGVYVFHLQVMAMAEHIAWLALQVNGEPVAYAWASGYTSATEQMGTSMTIQKLYRGDTVNVIQKESSNPPNYLYAHYTLFSGYKLN